MPKMTRLKHLSISVGNDAEHFLTIARSKIDAAILSWIKQLGVSLGIDAQHFLCIAWCEIDAATL